MRARGGARGSGTNGGRIGLRILGPSEQICCGRVRLPHRCAPLHFYHSLFFALFLPRLAPEPTTCQNWKVNQRSSGSVGYPKKKKKKTNNNNNSGSETERVRGGILSFSSSPTLSNKSTVFSPSLSLHAEMGSIRNDDNVLRLIWNFLCVCFILSFACFLATSDVWIQRELNVRLAA